jgi:hypothetical protein
MSFINSNVGSSSNIQCDAQPAIQEKAGKNSSHVGCVTHKLAKNIKYFQFEELQQF